MPGSLFPAPKQRFYDATGKPLVGGKVTTWAAGTSSKKTTFQDRALTSANTNPAILDARGEATMYGVGIYRVRVEAANGALIYDRDDVEVYGGVLDAIVVNIADVEAARAAAITKIETIANGVGLIKFYNIVPAGNTFSAVYSSGQCQRIAPLVTGMTTFISEWPVAGFYGELLLEIVNGGAVGFVIGTGINWVKSDGSATTSFADSGYALQSSGTDWVLLWTRNGGATVWGRVMR